MIHNLYICVLFNRKDLTPIGLANDQQLDLAKVAIAKVIP